MSTARYGKTVRRAQTRRGLFSTGQDVFAMLAIFLIASSSSFWIPGAVKVKGAALDEPLLQAPWTLPGRWGSVFSGQVVSAFGQPIAGAVIDVGSKRVQTNERGLFTVAFPAATIPDPNKFGVDPNSQPRYVLNIQKEGYAPFSGVYRGSVTDGLWALTPATVVSINPLRANVIKDIRPLGVCTGTLSSQVDWTEYAHRRTPRRVNSEGEYAGPASAEAERAAAFAEEAGSCGDGTTVTIPANSFVDSAGLRPTGEVAVTVSTIDIYSPTSMPGDYTVDLGVQTGYMVTYGAATVSARAGGRSLQLRKGGSLTLAVPIHPAQWKSAKLWDPNIPFLQYDERDGVWRIVGEATLDRDRMAYVAQVNHLSTFNMDLVKTDQACVRIDSSDIADDYSLEMSIPYGGDITVRTVSVDNTPEKIHVIYNLPSNTEIVLRAFKMVNGMPVPITDTIAVNTGAPQTPQTPNCPEYPYGACHGQVVLLERPLAPVLSGPGASSGGFTLHWDYEWSGYASTANGYELEESTTSSESGFSQIHTTVNGDDQTEHVDYPLTRATGDYWYRVRAKLSLPGYSPYSNVVHVVVDTGSGSTVTRFRNDSSYPLISLILDGTTQYIPTMMDSVLPGQYRDVPLSAGTHSYLATNGFWQSDGSRFEMYMWQGSYTQPSGTTFTISFPDPTINKLLTQFQNSGLWSGTYWTDLVPHTRAYRFFANGQWSRWVDNNPAGSGTYTLVSRDPSSFTVTFSTGQNTGTYYELMGYFFMQDGPASWPLIDYYYQGP